MQRISGYTALNGRFVNEDVQQGKPGTILDATWLNSVQEEIAAVVERSGGTLDANNQHQLADVVLQAQSDLSALMEFRRASGWSIDADVLAALETPAGLAITLADGGFYLVRGGHVHSLSDDSATGHRWAALHYDSANRWLTRAALNASASAITFDRVTLQPGASAIKQAGSGGYEAAKPSLVGAGPIDAGLVPSCSVDFLGGFFASADRFVWFRHAWFQAMDINNIEVLVRQVSTSAISDVSVRSEALGDYTLNEPPTPSFLNRRCVGGVVRVTDDASALKVVVSHPASDDSWMIIRFVSFTIDTSSLAVTNIDTATGRIYSLVKDGIVGGWCPGLEFFSPGIGQAIFFERLSTRVFKCAVASTTFSMTYADAAGMRLLGAHEHSNGGWLFFAEVSNKLAVLLYPSISSTYSLLATIPVPDFSARLDAAEADFGKRWAPNKQLSKSIVSATDRGVAVYAWGVGVSTRSPIYGLWRVFGIPPIWPLGSDDSGRMVAWCDDQVTPGIMVSDIP